MSEYISREAALEVFCMWCGICPKEKQKPLECDDILGNVLHSLPAADVRPVVRCRECRHWSEHPEGYLGVCSFISRNFVMENGYCAWGERKEEEQDNE